MGRVMITGLALAAALLSGTSASAGKLPAGATPLSAQEVTQLHSGNSGIYPTVDAYFAPDGTTIGTFGKPNVLSTFAGKWVVVGNTLCTLNGGKADPKVYVDCNSFWRAGDKIYLLWSTRSDGAKADTANGYFEVAGSLRPGNLVAEKYKAAGGT